MKMSELYHYVGSVQIVVQLDVQMDSAQHVQIIVHLDVQIQVVLQGVRIAVFLYVQEEKS